MLSVLEEVIKCNAAQCSTSPPSQMLMLMHMLMQRFSMLCPTTMLCLSAMPSNAKVKTKMQKQTEHIQFQALLTPTPLLGALDSCNSDSLPTVELNTTLSKSPSNLLGRSLIRVGLASDTVLAVQVGDEAIGELAGDEGDGVVGCNFTLNSQFRETVELDSDGVGAGFDYGFGLGDRNRLCDCNGLWGGHWCGERKSWEESEEGDGESGELHFDRLDVCLVV